MSQVDWSKAPNWADRHGYAGPDRHPVWLDGWKYTYCDGRQDGMVFAFRGGSSSRAISDVYGITDRPSTAWDGDGLPPVGTVCEYNNLEPHPVSTDLKWSPVHIVAHDAQGGALFAVFSSLSGYHGDRRPECFRPIRTPEQIAADASLHKIRNAHTAIARTLDAFKGDIPAESVSRQTIEAMIDAGYHKQKDE